MLNIYIAFTMCQFIFYFFGFHFVFLLQHICIPKRVNRSNVSMSIQHNIIVTKPAVAADQRQTVVLNLFG